MLQVDLRIKIQQIRQNYKPAVKIFHKIVELVAQLQEDESYIYLMESKHEFPPVEELITLFARNGLKLTERKDYLQGIISAQYCTKD